MYLAKPEVAQQYPALLRDINAAQAQVAELWKQGDAKAVDAMMQVTRLPEEVVREALGRTTPLAGLSDQAIDTILRQLQFNREHGTILKSDVWMQDPAKAHAARCSSRSADADRGLMLSLRLTGLRVDHQSPHRPRWAGPHLRSMSHRETLRAGFMVWCMDRSTSHRAACSGAARATQATISSNPGNDQSTHGSGLRLRTGRY